MARARRSPLARADLKEIADFIAQDNLDAAMRFLDQVDAVCQRLADFPGMGPRRDELQPGLRSFPIGNYLLLYRVVPGGIELARVIHGARNLDKIFED
jgi:toxin ParE1/3/4